MGRTEEVEKAERVIKDAEIRLRTLQVQLDALDREHAGLAWTEATLEDNLNCLKQEKIIALAVEFKKAKADLAKTRTRMIAVNNDRLKVRRSYEETDLLLKKSQEALAELIYSLENNVLYGTFGKQENGQG